ncbi:MAG: peptidase M20 [Chloroflexi bacterium]|nr:MAG: peptidase M20 [Chloroflexota bacterium]
MDALRQAASALSPEVVRLAIELAEVPAPTGGEYDRASRVCTLLRERGYAAQIDDIGNVYARRGTVGGAALMLAAHTDTVFPAHTPLKFTQTRGRIVGPGVGDNALGVAAVIGAFDLLDKLGIATAVDLIFVATVGEEGLGNLAGAKRALDRHAEETAAFVAVEGHNLGRVTCGGVGSVRWKLSVHGPGGHSWGGYGQPSAIHVLAQIITSLAACAPPVHPKTTFNVGVISGGTSVNSIASEASALIDLRSTSEAALSQFTARLRREIQRVHVDGISVNIETIGERPAGETARDHPLVTCAGDTLRALGIPPIFDSSSTDANVGMNRGIPSICIGISRGGGGHTLQEYIETDPIATGLTQLAALVIASAEQLQGSKA